jgi:hypothetical protein
VPPGTAPERLALLRKAFAATLGDKAFLAEVGFDRPLCRNDTWL